MRTKYIPLHLPKDVYSRLEKAATAEDRDPIQHARWLLKRALDARTPEAGQPEVTNAVAVR